MKVTLSPGGIKGELAAIPSKSHLHRLLICASLVGETLAGKETMLVCPPTNAEDITATINCLLALGAKIERREAGFAVTPIDRHQLPEEAVLPCMESGSTLRFMLPIVCVLGVRGRFEMAGRLPERPLTPLDAELSRNDIRLWKSSPNTLCCEGKLAAGNYSLPGNISSQYISGLLLALPLLEKNSSLTVKAPVESADYINMTTLTMEAFGFEPATTIKLRRRFFSKVAAQYIYNISGGVGFTSPEKITVEGDWSNAAFWLCAGAMPGGDIRCRGLNKQSSQGDRAVAAILEQMGANVKWEGSTLRISEGERRGVEIDARSVPDLVPVLCAVAAVAKGTTIIKNAGRLRLKESDRIAATAQTLNALGAKVTEEENGLRIEGIPQLAGGTADSWGDHRIAMMAAIACAGCEDRVTITGAQAVRKSYPSFWDELSAFGKVINDEPRPEGTGYRPSPEELHSGFNTFFKRPEGRGIKPLSTNKEE